MFDTSPHRRMISETFHNFHATVHSPLRNIRHPGTQESSSMLTDHGHAAYQH